MKTFVTENELYQNNPIETINTDLFTVVFKEFEQNYFLCMIVSHTGLYTDQVSVLTNFEQNMGDFELGGDWVGFRR